MGWLYLRSIHQGRCPLTSVAIKGVHIGISPLHSAPSSAASHLTMMFGGRRCGHHGSTAGRDANAVACRMDRAGRLWVAISVARSAMSDTGVRGRTSKSTVYIYLNPESWEPMRPRYLVRVRGQWGSSLGRSVKVMGASYDLSETKTGSTAQCGQTGNSAIFSSL